ncbi:hypothetical protein Selin_2482 [Desulfurispirillum indicum S5]|uniref:Uncharacterized protein n=1 Tax=Desulfurispirillum indicum (strain ATCC BAA-1389 / DSM 22839 / S5) TaxID=653733 RepID=E6W5R2_DESIS|nr:hypothetical protein [Desulfurispirillum indicum]ADU67197.1 hypothetical protein Selin_2482 [Desulfurispirillum indicum S5]
MEFRQRFWAAALVALLSAGAAMATTVTGRSSTMLEWYDDPDGNSALPAYQYLMLNARNIHDTGIDFRFYGRLGTDLNDEVDADNRFYYAYAEKRGINDAIDLRVGRQFIFNPAGSSIMDGVNMNYDDGSFYTFSLFGGGDAQYYEGYHEKDLMFGGKVGGRFFDNNLKMNFAYLEKRDAGDTSHKLLGADAYYDHNNTVEVYGDYQFNYLADTMSYLRVGANYYQNEDWQVRTEYLSSKPVFSATSIYSVFAVSEYEEVMAQLTYRLGPGMFAFGRLTHEMYEEVSNANVIEAGIEQVRMERFSGSFSGVLRQHDEGQDLFGVRARGSYLLNHQYQVGGGASIDVFERSLQVYDGSETSLTGMYEETTHRIWADVTAFLSRAASLEARIERIQSDRWDEYYYGRIRFNYHF